MTSKNTTNQNPDGNQDVVSSAPETMSGADFQRMLSEYPELESCTTTSQILDACANIVGQELQKNPEALPNGGLILEIIKANYETAKGMEGVDEHISDISASTSNIVDEILKLSTVPAEVLEMLKTQMLLGMNQQRVKEFQAQIAFHVQTNAGSLEKLEAKEALLAAAERKNTKIERELKALQKRSSIGQRLRAKLAAAGCLKYAIGLVAITGLTLGAAFFARERVMNRKIKRVAAKSLDILDKTIDVQQEAINVADTSEKILLSVASGRQTATEGGKHSLTANLQAERNLLALNDNCQEFAAGKVIFQYSALESQMALRNMARSLGSNPRVTHEVLTNTAKGAEASYVEFLFRAAASQHFGKSLQNKLQQAEAIIDDESLRADQKAEQIAALDIFNNADIHSQIESMSALVELSMTFLDRQTELSVQDFESPQGQPGTRLQRHFTQYDAPANEVISDEALNVALETGNFDIIRHKTPNRAQLQRIIDTCKERGILQLFDQHEFSKNIYPQNIVGGPAINSAEDLFTYISDGAGDLSYNMLGTLVRQRRDGAPHITQYSEHVHHASDQAVTSTQQRIARVSAALAELSPEEQSEILELSEREAEIGRMRQEQRELMQKNQELLTSLRQQEAELNSMYQMDDKGAVTEWMDALLESTYDSLFDPNSGK